MFSSLKARALASQSLFSSFKARALASQSLISSHKDNTFFSPKQVFPLIFSPKASIIPIPYRFPTFFCPTKQQILLCKSAEPCLRLVLSYPGTSLARHESVLSYPGTSLAHPSAVLSYPGTSLAQTGSVLSYPGTSLAQTDSVLSYPGTFLAQNCLVTCYGGTSVGHPRPLTRNSLTRMGPNAPFSCLCI